MRYSLHLISTESMDSNSIEWKKEAKLQGPHINGAMVQHKGRMTMVGGTETTGQGSIATVEILDQNLQINDDGTINRWVFGQPYPFSVEQHAIISTTNLQTNFLFVFGRSCIFFDSNWFQVVQTLTTITLVMIHFCTMLKLFTRILIQLLATSGRNMESFSSHVADTILFI